MSAAYFKLKLLRKKRAKAQKELTKKSSRSDKNRSSDQNIICRICLNAGSIYIYGVDLPFDVQDAIRTFGGVAIQKDDSFPKHLCDNCFSQLNVAVLFRKSAKESEKTLSQALTQYTNKTIDIDDDSNYFDDSPPDEHTVTVHSCETCNLDFATAEEYLKHKSSKQHKNVRIQCHICHKVFTPQLYNNHVKTHKSASHLVCEVCGKLFRKDNLIRHLQLHTNELPFQCQVCPYRGRFLESLKIHMRTHSGDKPFSCNECKLRFLTRSNLNRHLLTHKKDKPHKCIECGRGFYTQRDLDVHFKADHNGIKDYSCRLCENKYSSRKAVMRHELRVHKRDKMVKGRMPLYLQAEYRKDNISKECDPLMTYL